MGKIFQFPIRQGVLLSFGVLQLAGCAPFEVRDLHHETGQVDRVPAADLKAKDESKSELPWELVQDSNSTTGPDASVGSEPKVSIQVSEADEFDINFEQNFASTTSLAKSRIGKVSRTKTNRGQAKGVRSWASYLEANLERFAPKLLQRDPQDVRQFCPAYSGLSKQQKKQFWIYLLTNIAKLESNLNPTVAYKEGFKDSSGRRVVSRGLLQISFESSKAYGCGFRSAQELHNPTANLACGARILNTWIGQDQVIRGGKSGRWKGGARYWAVLRNKSDTIRNRLRSQPICRGVGQSVS